MNPLYDLQQVLHQYGARTVLTIDALTIDTGETLALIGPSGAGKSTLLRLLCLLEQPTAGTIRYAGTILEHAIPLAVRRAITLVFQRPLLLDTTVWHNVMYPLQIRGQRDDHRVRSLIDLLGLGSVIQARARTLSGGEMQRVALARALVIRPRVLLLDEPTANLDPHNVALMEQAITEMQREHGTTIVLATHNLHQARRLSTRTAMLLDGMLIEVGTSKALLEAASDSRTRAFVQGVMIR